MNRLPSNWKLFRIATFVSLILQILIFFFLISVIKWEHLTKGASVVGFVLLTGAMLAIICCLINLHLMKKHFFKPMTVIQRGFYFTLTVLNALYKIALSVLFTWGLSEELKNTEDDKNGIYLLVFLFFTLSAGIYTGVKQFNIPNTLSKNQRQSMQDMIDNIGQQAHI